MFLPLDKIIKTRENIPNCTHPIQVRIDNMGMCNMFGIYDCYKCGVCGGILNELRN